MKVISVGTKVKINDMGVIGYVDEVIVTSPVSVLYKILFYQKNASSWNTVILPEVAISIAKGETKEPTQIGF